MSRFLFVVASRNHRLYDYLKWKFAGEESIEVVVLERRLGQRRQRIQAHEFERRIGERRRAERRRRSVSEDDLRTYGFVVIRQQ